MIKFNEQVKELEQGTFFLRNIDHFVDNGGEMIQDYSEGIIKLSESEISANEIIKRYSENLEAYICCFTVLFDSDFDSKGQIKESTLDKILRRGGMYPEKRDAVIFSCNGKQNIMKVFDNMYHNTPEFKNVDLKKPDLKKIQIPNTNEFETTQIFNTNNIEEWKQNIRWSNIPYENRCEACKSLKCNRIKNDYIRNFFEKEGWLGNNKVEMGFKGSYVYYRDLAASEEEAIKQLFNNIQNSADSPDIMKYEELLQYCFLQKGSSYKTQNEYRILIYQFSDRVKLPDSIKLTYNAKNLSSKWWAKIIKNDEVSELNLNDFMSER